MVGGGPGSDGALVCVGALVEGGGLGSDGALVCVGALVDAVGPCSGGALVCVGALELGGGPHGAEPHLTACPAAVTGTTAWWPTTTQSSVSRSPASPPWTKP